jgi:hypothetical protein
LNLFSTLSLSASLPTVALPFALEGLYYLFGSVSDPSTITNNYYLWSMVKNDVRTRSKVVQLAEDLFLENSNALTTEDWSSYELGTIVSSVLVHTVSFVTSTTAQVTMINVLDAEECIPAFAKYNVSFALTQEQMGAGEVFECSSSTAECTVMSEEGADMVVCECTQDGTITLKSVSTSADDQENSINSSVVVTVVIGVICAIGATAFIAIGVKRYVTGLQSSTIQETRQETELESAEKSNITIMSEVNNF